MQSVTVMMWWRLLITLLLAAILALLVWDRDRVVSVLPQLSTPHEAYVHALTAAGLADTALARDWIAAAEAALREPTDANVPLETTIAAAAAEPRAYGYRLALQRGRVLRVVLQVDSPEEPLVFIDVFRVREEEDAPERVVSAARHSRELEHEIRRDGSYIVRIQPELLRGGTMQVVQRTTASLTFPVTGRDASAVGSFFRDPRDGGSREHHGIDIFAPRDTPVLAASDGYVTSVGTNRLGGQVVWVWDPARRQSHYYAHLSRQAVTTGQRLRAGDLVGFVGNTGNARGTPPHLHFGIYARGEGPIDPLPFVRGARGPQPSAGEAGGAGSATKPRQTSTGIGG